MEAKLFVLLALCYTVSSVPINTGFLSDAVASNDHIIMKRFVNPSLPFGEFSRDSLSRVRTRRSEEECEKLNLCKLHARSQHNLMAAFQLYFVNKENARLWDHRAHTISECYQLYSCYR
ncbi:uncharacterized protein LOC110996067 [Pieris rapae]|uniref:uncharacterized protein LOC110996067 n=1 Tax=Pieris rapae TaxID=64459 RepID=UPI001E28060F|nr:uncharacterized protein LOC110996067 [Pieris rapae]